MAIFIVIWSVVGMVVYSGLIIPTMEKKGLKCITPGYFVLALLFGPATTVTAMIFIVIDYLIHSNTLSAIKTEMYNQSFKHRG